MAKTLDKRMVRRMARRLARERDNYVGFPNAHVQGDEPEQIVIHAAHPKETQWPN